MDEAELGVGPVKLLLLQVDGQPVGPVNVRVHDDFAGAAIHPRPLDSGRLAPVCPVHVPKEDGRGERAKPSAFARGFRVRSLQTGNGHSGFAYEFSHRRYYGLRFVF